MRPAHHARIAVITCLILAAPAVAQQQSTTLDQLAREIQTTHSRYSRASGTQRAELEDSLRQLLRQRAIILKALVAVDPGSVLRAALPSALIESLPADLLADVEQSIRAEGTLDELGGPATRASFRFRDRQGRGYAFHPIGPMPSVVGGSTIRVTGIAVGDHLIVNGRDIQVRSRTPTDTSPPSVRFANPRQGETVRGKVTVRVEATDQSRVSQVTAFRDGKLLGSRDTMPYEFLWDTAQDADGPHSLSARAEDPDLNVGVTPPHVVTIDNTPPRAAILSPAPRASLSGSTRVEAEATDTIGIGSVKLLVDGLAAGVAVTQPYSFPLDTTDIANGPHTLQVEAVDRAGNHGRSEPVNVKVLNANAGPVLSPIGAKTVDEAVGLSFTVQASDPDGLRDPLRFTAANLPPWAHFDPVTRRFSGTPGFDVATSDKPTIEYPTVSITVCDPQPVCDSETFPITVKNVNRPPVLSDLRDVTVREGDELLVAPVPADLDGDALRCMARGVPKWATFDPASCSIRGVPDFEVCSYEDPVKLAGQVRLTVCDPLEVCEQHSFTITVTNAARRTVLRAVPDQTVDEETPLRVVFTAENPDNKPLSWKASALPRGAVFEVFPDGTAAISWTPRADQSGSHTISVTVSDDTQGDARTFRINVRETVLAISGRVSNDTGLSTAGIKVEAYRSGADRRAALSDDKGLYVITGLSADTYTVKASQTENPDVPSDKGFYFTPFSQRIELESGVDRKDIDFTMRSR